MYVLFSVFNYIERKFTWNTKKTLQYHIRSFNFISGVCFYGKTAERVLSILATGNHRALFPPGKMFWIIYQKWLFICLRIRYIKTM